jgi:hypothetical protein
LRREELELSILGNLRNAIAEKLISTQHLESNKAEWEQVLVDARNGEFDDNEQAIIDAREELESINKALDRRHSSR